MLRSPHIKADADQWRDRVTKLNERTTGCRQCYGTHGNDSELADTSGLDLETNEGRN
jgi:hypothetical protein